MPRKPTNGPTNPTAETTPRSNAGSSAFDRVLPHSSDAERALLGSMLQDSGAIGEAITVLQDAGREAFFFEKHQVLYDQIVKLYDRNVAIDGVVIANELERQGLFAGLGGYEFLASLVGAVPSALRVRDYSAIVREKFLLRRLIQALHRSMDAAFNDRLPAAEILDEAEKLVFDVTERRVSAGAAPLTTLIEQVFRSIENRGEGAITGVPTGYFQLDDLTCGMQPAELIIVAGRPSMGKTALGLNMAEHMALREDPPRPAIFFSLEMSQQQVGQRVLCSMARVDSHRLRRGGQTDAEMQRLQMAADEIRQKPLYIDDTSSLTILELRARARMAKRKLGIQVVLVDYLQLLRAPGTESRQTEVAEISRGLKALAKELHVPVIAMAQLNRGPEDRSTMRPRMSDLRESGAIEQDADVVMLLHRESYQKAPDDLKEGEDTAATLIIAKQRNGPVGDIALHFNRKLTRFDNPQLGSQYGDVYEAYQDRASDGGAP